MKKNRHPPVKMWKKLKPIVLEMRKYPTPAEDLLWDRLRNRRLGGVKFRRQHAIDRFVVDFCSIEEALVIEVDGPIHEKQVEEDQERDQVLAHLGFRVVRFSNDLVLQETDQVIDAIQDIIGRMQTNNHQHGDPK